MNIFLMQWSIVGAKSKLEFQQNEYTSKKERFSEFWEGKTNTHTQSHEREIKKWHGPILCLVWCCCTMLVSMCIKIGIRFFSHRAVFLFLALFHLYRSRELIVKERSSDNIKPDFVKKILLLINSWNWHFFGQTSNQIQPNLHFELRPFELL